MSVAKKIAIIALLASTSTAQAYTADSKEYQDVMSEYAKKVFAARYTEKLCYKQEGIRYNETYFSVAPPTLWTKEVYDKFMGASMVRTRGLMDKELVRLGEGTFCQAMRSFYTLNYREAVKPVLFDK